MPKLVPLSEFKIDDEFIEPVETSASRRNFLARAGVVGLVAATGLFNQAGVANAYIQYYCCRLLYTSHCGYSYCVQNGEYIWSCDGAGRHCACCEWYARSCSGARCCAGSDCVYY